MRSSVLMGAALTRRGAVHARNGRRNTYSPLRYGRAGGATWAERTPLRTPPRMLDQRGVAVLLHLFQELGFVHSCQLERATRGFGNHMQHAQPVASEMPVDRHHVHRELTSSVFDGQAAVDRCHDLFPQCQIVSCRSNNLYSPLMLAQLSEFRYERTAKASLHFPNCSPSSLPPVGQHGKAILTTALNPQNPVAHEGGPSWMRAFGALASAEC